MRFQIWALIAKHVSGAPSVAFEKIAEGANIGALLPAFRDALTNGSATRAFLVDTTNQTVTVLLP